MSENTITLCWNCHKSYYIDQPTCSHCGKINANINYSGARAQMLAKVKAQKKE
jgi:ribosomal protein L37E